MAVSSNPEFLPDRLGVWPQEGLHGNEAKSMAIDPRASLDTAKHRAHRAKKSAGRLLVSGLGFAAAYFLDPDHGKARRGQAFQFIDHIRRARADGKAGQAGHAEPEVPVKTTDAPGPRGAFQRAANGIRATSRW